MSLRHSFAAHLCANRGNSIVRCGFSLIELIVASAIIAMIGAGTLAAIAFFESSTVDASNQKASKNLLTNAIDQAHSIFTEDLKQFQDDVNANDGVQTLTASSRGISAIASINEVLGDAARFAGQNPECAIESTDLTNKTITLDSDCPAEAFTSLELLNSIDEPAPIHVIGAPSICAIHRVTSSSRTLHLCPDTDGCVDAVATTDCIPLDSESDPIIGSEVLMPRYVIRDSDTANSGDPLSYLIESAGVVGPSQVSLVIDDNYYDSFENTVLTDACAGGTCKVPVQESVARNINPDGRIRVSSDSLAAYTEDVTVIITALDTTGDPALGSLTVSTEDGFLADDDADNAHILEIEGPLITLNDTLETLSYTGNTGIFEEVDVKVQMIFGSLEQSTGPDANHIASDIRLEVYPNCGCEAQGRTAVTFRLGQWNSTTSSFIDQDDDGLPLNITTIALQNTDDHSTFYGYGQTCIGIGGTCVGSTKQQTIASDDALAIFLYEYTDTSATASNKFSMFFFDDAYDNNCARTEAESGTSLWNGISNGVGTWDDDINAPGGTISRWGCYAEIGMENIPPRLPTSPFLKPESAGGEGGDFSEVDTYSGNMFTGAQASWGRINTNVAGGGRSDGFVMMLPVSTADAGLETYSVGNPRFIVTEYNSLQSWRIRSARMPEDYSGNSCPATMPDEEGDPNAWISYVQDDDLLEKLAIPQALWNDALATDNDSSIWGNSTNAIELMVQTAKVCPNPAIFE